MRIVQHNTGISPSLKPVFVKLLLSKSADVNARNQNGETGASHFCRRARNLSFEARGCEAGGRRKESEGRSQKKCFYKYEMLPVKLL